MLLDIIFMFCIDLHGFSIGPLYLVYNYAEHETPVLHIFKFMGSSGTQMELELFWRDYFYRRNNMRGRSTREGQRGPSDHWWRGPEARPRHPRSFALHASDAVHLDLRLTGLT
jgi:hypothetical protein